MSHPMDPHNVDELTYHIDEVQQQQEQDETTQSSKNTKLSDVKHSQTQYSGASYVRHRGRSLSRHSPHSFWFGRSCSRSPSVDRSGAGKCSRCEESATKKRAEAQRWAKTHVSTLMTKDVTNDDMSVSFPSHSLSRAAEVLVPTLRVEHQSVSTSTQQAVHDRHSRSRSFGNVLQGGDTSAVSSTLNSCHPSVFVPTLPNSLVSCQVLIASAHSHPASLSSQPIQPEPIPLEPSSTLLESTTTPSKLSSLSSPDVSLPSLDEDSPLFSSPSHVSQTPSPLQTSSPFLSRLSNTISATGSSLFTSPSVTSSLSLNTPRLPISPFVFKPSVSPSVIDTSPSSLSFPPLSTSESSISSDLVKLSQSSGSSEEQRRQTIRAHAAESKHHNISQTRTCAIHEETSIIHEFPLSPLPVLRARLPIAAEKSISIQPWIPQRLPSENVCSSTQETTNSLGSDHGSRGRFSNSQRNVQRGRRRNFDRANETAAVHETLKAKRAKLFEKKLNRESGINSSREVDDLDETELSVHSPAISRSNDPIPNSRATIDNRASSSDTGMSDVNRVEIKMPSCSNNSSPSVAELPTQRNFCTDLPNVESNMQMQGSDGGDDKRSQKWLLDIAINFSTGQRTLGESLRALKDFTHAHSSSVALQLPVSTTTVSSERPVEQKSLFFAPPDSLLESSLSSSSSLSATGEIRRRRKSSSSTSTRSSDDRKQSQTKISGSEEHPLTVSESSLS